MNHVMADKWQLIDHDLNAALSLAQQAIRGGPGTASW
jgi:hypothetical protein